MNELSLLVALHVSILELCSSITSVSPPLFLLDSLLNEYVLI